MERFSGASETSDIEILIKVSNLSTSELHLAGGIDSTGFLRNTRLDRA